MKLNKKLDRWQLMGILAFISFLFSLSTKTDGVYFVELYFNFYDTVVNMFYRVMVNNVLMEYIFINYTVLLTASIILMIYFIFNENIYLYSFYAFIFSLIILFQIINGFISVGYLGIRVYIISSSYIFTIFSLYYSLSEIYTNYESKTIQEIMYHKNTIFIALSAWFILILNIFLIIISHVRI